MLYLGPLVHETLDDPEVVSSELRSALGEMSSVSFYTPKFVIDIFYFIFFYETWHLCRCRCLEVVFGGCSVAQEPGGGAADRGAGFQRGHAAHAGALHGTHGCRLRCSSVLWCRCGLHRFRV